MERNREEDLATAVRDAAVPMDKPGWGKSLMEVVGGAQFVFLGEATHGTHEFYAARAEITMHLIREKGFAAVAMEADWPDAYRINRYVRDVGTDRYAIDALGGFRWFPHWLWRNTDMLDFVGMLREHNNLLPEQGKVSFYGLDLYSLYSSIDAAISHLEMTDPVAAGEVRQRYSRFEQFDLDPETQGLETALNVSDERRDTVVSELRDLLRRRFDPAGKDGLTARQELFYARQNAILSKNAEEYYRSMFSGRTDIWNLRDRHMADTLEALAGYIGETRPPKIVVWGHNSHIGDARGSDMSSRGKMNVGQLARERHGGATALIGFTTYGGTVSAASDWGEPVERKRVRSAIADSYEALFHRTGLSPFLLNLRNLPVPLEGLRERRLERAIGVVYLPGEERASHYIQASLPEQFDAVIHYDQSFAVEPLERTPLWEEGEVPEIYATGL